MAVRTVVLAGGGTGGHVYPALSVGDAVRDRGHRVLYYGDPDRLEGRVVEPRGYTLRPVRAVGYPRSGVLGRIRFALALVGATLRSARWLRKDGADVVLGVGGYVSAPTVLAAWLLGIPRIIHEANVAPGLANRLCARVASRILLTYEATAHRLPGRAPRETVGCPVNPKVLEGDRASARTRYGLSPDRPVLLVVGGSLGAARLNDLALAAARLPGRTFQVLHIAGPRYFADVRAALDPVPEGVVLVDYEHRMADAYAAADLVVCRAGSSTLAEVTLLGRPTVLVPSPNVTDNHQEANARGLEAAGAALVMVERDLEPAQALDRISSLLNDASTLEAMGRAARALGRGDTADHIADIVLAEAGEPAPRSPT
ncbi:MAG: undecaprenyldiphospho-muramoylpentapeptide beta-N-acetylglucosaminyltransferase [Deltaproteobacteria bacterium]|nr:undecaprenyldiphospho-muramoylpentapeptide beta-N-acetylglucosaminyltransferase [Deltaproteobacteria bacterium]